MAMLRVNGVDCPDPSEFTYGLQSVSASDAGRTEDATMHVNLVAQKRKLNLGWQNIRPEKASAILQLFDSEYFDVTYFDLKDGNTQTRTFYVGDRSAPYHWWHSPNGQVVSKLAFNIIER